MTDESTDVPEGHKRCYECNIVKPASEFASAKRNRDGLNGKCKACANAVEKARYAAKSDAEKEEMRQRRRNYNRANREKAREYQIAWNKQNGDKLTRTRIGRKPTRQIGLKCAHTWVSNGVRRGKLPKATTQLCAVCGREAQQYHHPDYSKPSQVVPLCFECHGKERRID